MTKSSLHREWVSTLSKCVYVEIHQIDSLIMNRTNKVVTYIFFLLTSETRGYSNLKLMLFSIIFALFQ